MPIFEIPGKITTTINITVALILQYGTIIAYIRNTRKISGIFLFYFNFPGLYIILIKRVYI